jgi:8-oxo-dGTP pyrophosphatase MutT (NUDIX family)
MARHMVPETIINNLRVKLDTNRDIIETFKEIEKAHWDYLDNYRDQDRARYPSMTIYQFSQKVLESKGFHTNRNDIQNYMRIFNRFKKNVPTAGVIFYHRADPLVSNDSASSSSFVVVRMRFSNVWSMPKGKKEPSEELINTAKREFLEETGIDLDDHISSTTSKVSINKTLFYLVQSDVINKVFDGYNKREIEEVKWINAADATDINQYSRQTVAVAKYLMSQSK